jgi:hypothetical protein
MMIAASAGIHAKLSKKCITWKPQKDTNKATSAMRTMPTAEDKDPSLTAERQSPLITDMMTQNAMRVARLRTIGRIHRYRLEAVSKLSSMVTVWTSNPKLYLA